MNVSKTFGRKEKKGKKLTVLQMRLRQTANCKRQTEENGLVIDFSRHFTFASSRDVNKN